MRRARLALAQAELALFIVDARERMTAEDRRLIAELPPNLPLLIVHNKIDLAAPPAPTGADELQISAATGAGVERLIDELHHRPEIGRAPCRESVCQYV